MWPKFEDKVIGYKLASTGAVKDEVYSKEGIVFYLLDFLKENYPSVLIEKYNLDLEMDKVEMLDKICISKGLLTNSEVVYERTYSAILNDYRNLRLGRLTLDKL